MELTNRENIIDTLTFQGSQDGTTYSDLFVVDKNVHDGWNYHKWESTAYPKFRYYRFYGLKKYSCLINEVQFSGIETIDDTNPVYTCSAKVNIGNNSTNLTS